MAGRTANRRRGRSRVRRALVGLVAVELVYLVLGNVFLRTDLGPDLLHPASGKWSVDWQTGHTFLPGLVHVEGLDIRWNVRRSNGQVTAEKVDGLLLLPSLAFRHLSTRRTHATGVAFRLDPVTPSDPPPVRKRRGWKFTLGGLDVQQLSQIAVASERWAGDGRLRGTIAWQVRGPVELDVEELILGRTSLPPDATQYLTELQLSVHDLTLGPVRIAKGTLPAVLESTSGRLELTSHSKSLAFLRFFLQKAPWLRLDGVGDLELSLGLTQGVAEPGSHLKFSGPEVGIRYFRFGMQGAGGLGGTVTDETIELSAELDSFQIELDENEGAVEGDRVAVRLTSSSRVIYEPTEDLEVLVTLPSAVAPDVAVFSSYIPPAAGLRLDSGRAEVAAEILYDTGEGTGSGRVSMGGEAIRARLGDFDFGFDLDFELRLSDARLEEGKVGLGGTRLDLDRVVEYTEGGSRLDRPDWWAKVRVPRGETRRVELEGKTLPGLDFDVEADLRDSALVLDYLTTRVHKLGWFQRFLEVQDVQGRAKFDLAGSRVRVEDLSVTGGDAIEVLGDLETVEGDRQGVLFARYKKVSAALALGITGQERDWKLTRSRDWYLEQAAAFDGRTGNRAAGKAGAAGEEPVALPPTSGDG